MELEYRTSDPKITKDGVTIIKNLRHSDSKIEMGIALMRELAHTTNEYCGDGTTTSAVLANSIFSRGLKVVESGYNPMEVKKGIELAKKEVVQYLKFIKTDIDPDWEISREMIRKSAMVKQ